MKKYPSAVILLFLCLISVASFASDEKRLFDYRIYVDDAGVMRRSDTNAEVSYFGTNYTLPFAHAWRQINQRGLNPYEVMKQDVYHFKRLGFNAFRLHLWEAELTDEKGNLLDNKHLDALDKLIALLEDNDIDIILTAQTNFGNGYPERDIDTGAFTYDFNKCDIHSNPAAIKAQENYLKQLASHVNPHTGKSYGKDTSIIGIEINNEPCHQSSVKQVERYISRMAKALRKGGFEGIIFYNVSHNPDVTEAYYKVKDVKGTTYQWYPDGLVAGHLRKGNYLPVVGAYPIPWGDKIPEYKTKAKIVYEFDPGDVLYTHLYPAIARTFRKGGFQWATQFAYDPTPIAPYNTEYQTHYLNLLYTPGKALSMAVAGEAMRTLPRGNAFTVADFNYAPEDTVFGDFRVSYNLDLSEYNSAERRIHTRSTNTPAANISKLSHIAATGSSPEVEYHGTGAYFLDRVPSDKGDDSTNSVWRLEILPDAAIINDPFEKPNPNKEVAHLWERDNPITISLPQLSGAFYVKKINDPELIIRANDVGTIMVSPGVYLLSNRREDLECRQNVDSMYAACYIPESDNGFVYIEHSPSTAILKGDSLIVEAQYYGEEIPDSLLIYPSGISFWRKDNKLVKMERLKDKFGNNTWKYRAVIPAEDIKIDNNGNFHYNIVAVMPGREITYPGNVAGNPLSWEYVGMEQYKVPVIRPESEIVLINPDADLEGIDVSVVPEDWNFNISYEKRSPIKPDVYRVETKDTTQRTILLRKYINLVGHPTASDKENIVIKTEASKDKLHPVTLALYTRTGDSLGAPVEFDSTGYARINLKQLKGIERYVVPAQYPGFLPRILPGREEAGIDDARNIDFIELRIDCDSTSMPLLLEGVWLE